MASMSPVSATTVVYFFNDSSNVMVFSCKRQSDLDLSAHCWRRAARFKVSDLTQPAAVPVGAAERGSEEALRAVPSDRNTRGATSEAEDVHVVILDALACREIVVTKRRTCADHLVRSNGSTYATSTDENASPDLSRRHGTGQGQRKIWVVIVSVIDLVAEIHDLMPFFREQPGKLLLHFESTMIRAYAHYHVTPPFSPPSDIWQSGSSPRPRSFPR